MGIGLGERNVLAPGAPDLTSLDVPLQQTDGTQHHPDVILSRDLLTGGDDELFAGEGADIVLGGSGMDHIETFGQAHLGEMDADIVAGDNATVTFVNGEFQEIDTTAVVDILPADAQDNDTIITGNGDDLVFGGNGSDDIDTGIVGDFDYGDVDILSINFVADVCEGQVTGIAGAAMAQNWNNLPFNWSRSVRGSGYDDQTCSDVDPSKLYFDDGTTEADVELAIGGVMTRRGRERLVRPYVEDHISLDPQTQSQRLFEGYYHSGVWIRPLELQVSGLENHFDVYDVYVYIDASEAEHGDLPAPSYPAVNIGDTTYYMEDPYNNRYEGTFVQVTSTDSINPGIGNFVVFKDVQGDDLALRVTSNEDVRREDNKLSISAIQIVGGPDKDLLVTTGDYDHDRVVGDNGTAKYLNDGTLELTSTNIADVESGVQADTIKTGVNNDIVIAGNGKDIVQSGEGDDLLFGDNAQVFLNGDQVIGLDAPEFDPHNTPGILLLTPAIAS